MGGGPVVRALAGVGTLGLSELTQKKPFQDLGNDSPVQGSGGVLRFIPGGSQIGGLMGMLTNEMTPDKPNLTAAPTLGGDDEAKKAEQRALDAERQRAGRGRVSTIFAGDEPGASGTPKLKRFLGGY